MGEPIALTRTIPRPMTPETWAAIGGLGAITLATAPFADQPGPAWYGVTAFLSGAVLVGEFATSVLLFMWFRAERTWSLLVLASAYLFSTMMILPYLATFPGAVAQGMRLLGGAQTGAWVVAIWGCGFALLALVAAALEARPRRLVVATTTAASAPLAATVAVATTVGVVVAIATAGPRFMPDFVADDRWTPAFRVMNGATLLLLFAGITLILLRLRHSELFGWLAVALASMMAAQILVALAGGRFTVGWLVARGCLISAGCVLLGYFLTLFARQQRVLALAREDLETQIEERTRALRNALASRDLLLREVYHRVKNNLQIVDSLLHLQSRRLATPEARAPLEDTRRRIYALGLVHQQLLADVDDHGFAMPPFLEALIDNLSNSLGADALGVQVSADIDPIVLDIDRATPIGLVVSELVTNAVKHAFHDEADKRVEVHLVRTHDGGLALTVSDSGSQGGLRAWSNSRAAGAEIVRALARQLDASITVQTEPHGAVTLTLREAQPTAAEPA